MIDLSHAAAKEIDLIGPGVGQVEVTVIGTPAIPEPALFAVQIGAFREKANADRAEQSMSATYGAAKRCFARAIRPSGASSPDAKLRRKPPKCWPTASARNRMSREAFVVRLDP